MSYILAIAAIAAFILGLRRLRPTQILGNAIAVARDALATLGDVTLADERKEREARAASLRLLICSAKILVAFTLAVALPLGILALPVTARLVSLTSLTHVLESPPLVAVSSVVCLAALLSGRG